MLALVGRLAANSHAQLGDDGARLLAGGARSSAVQSRDMAGPAALSNRR
ncbi:hypothetical protein [Streptomyces sp. SBT349]|nr:hypothetical protein [Streptomyces sp. SBT349]